LTLQEAPPGVSPSPVPESSRINSLDLIRGIAVLGILLMNAVSYKLGQVPYWNISAGGSETWIDWSIAVFGEIFVDQKFMGLFSLLFGAGMMLFIDRAAQRQRRPNLLSLWRNALLLVIGILHTLLWEGDVLVLYALCSVFLMLLRKRSAKLLIALGTVAFLLPVVFDLWMQSVVNSSDLDLTGVWTEPGAEISGLTGMVMLPGYCMRALGMILIGAGLYRIGFPQGELSTGIYKKTAIFGLGVGLPLAALGIIFTAWNQFSREVAYVGGIPNSLGTIPASLGYLSLIVLWDKVKDNRLKKHLRAAGRMALTNYLSQSVLGVLILTIALSDVTVNRTGILVFVLAVWVVQLWLSGFWLNRFRFGPVEWLWRVATYRRGQPLLQR
jgi:uncharacterized protein